MLHIHIGLRVGRILSTGLEQKIDLPKRIIVYLAFKVSYENDDKIRCKPSHRNIEVPGLMSDHFSVFCVD